MVQAESAHQTTQQIPLSSAPAQVADSAAFAAGAGAAVAVEREDKAIASAVAADASMAAVAAGVRCPP